MSTRNAGTPALLATLRPVAGSASSILHSPGIAQGIAPGDGPRATTAAGGAPAFSSSHAAGHAAVDVSHVARVASVGVPAPPPASPANAGSIGGAVFALLLVVGLILGMAWIARRMPGAGGAHGNAALRIVGSLSLGPRERVVVVAVGNTQLLLGVGAGGTRTLHTLVEPLALAVPKRAPAFAQLLAQHLGKKP